MNTFYQILQNACTSTFNELGDIYLEEHYQKTLKYFLEQWGVVVEIEKEFIFKTSFDLDIGNGRIDLFCTYQDQQYILELKAHCGQAAFGRGANQVRRYKRNFSGSIAYLIGFIYRGPFTILLC